METREICRLDQPATGPSEMITVEIKSPDQGDEARLLSAFLGWIGRHFGAEVQTINIQYQPAGRRSRG